MADTLVRLREVKQQIPFSRSSIYLKMSLGEFPRPINIGRRAVAWRQADIDQWIANRIQASREQEEKAVHDSR